jgi:hypothetical protein
MVMVCIRCGICVSLVGMVLYSYSKRAGNTDSSPVGNTVKKDDILLTETKGIRNSRKKTADVTEDLDTKGGDLLVEKKPVRTPRRTAGLGKSSDTVVTGSGGSPRGRKKTTKAHEERVERSRSKSSRRRLRSEKTKESATKT